MPRSRIPKATPPPNLRTGNLIHLRSLDQRDDPQAADDSPASSGRAGLGAAAFHRGGLDISPAAARFHKKP